MSGDVHQKNCEVTTSRRDVAQLHIAHKLAFRGVERVTSISDDLHQILREVRKPNSNKG